MWGVSSSARRLISAPGTAIPDQPFDFRLQPPQRNQVCLQYRIRHRRTPIAVLRCNCSGIDANATVFEPKQQPHFKCAVVDACSATAGDRLSDARRALARSVFPRQSGRCGISSPGSRPTSTARVTADLP
jgi:hypothetical protein